jgi:hypothetical protein
MGFLGDLINSIMGDLGADLAKWIALRTANTDVVRWLKNRLDPEQLHSVTRELLGEALAEGLDGVVEEDCARWKEILTHPDNRLQLLGWVLEWDEDSSPMLGEWSLENAPDADTLRVVLVTIHRVIQQKKQKYFPPLLF